jgi:hypothetical protein
MSVVIGENEKTPKNNRMKKKLRMIMVDDNNYQKLQQLGHVPDSFNTVIGRLINFYFEHTNTKPTVGAAVPVK